MFADTAMILFPLARIVFTLINTSDLVHVVSIVRGNTLNDLQLLLDWSTDKRITGVNRIRLFISESHRKHCVLCSNLAHLLDDEKDHAKIP